MASGTITGAMTGDYGLRIRWESVPDIATNTSKFTMRVYVLHPAIDISTRSGCYTTIDGSKVEFSTAAIDKSAGETLIKTRTATITHGSDGKKSIKVVAYFPIYVKSASEGWIYEKKASGTCVLDDIPRASEISSQTQAVTVNGANKWNIAVNRHAESFWHKAVLTIGNYSHETPAFETTADYAIPTDWLNAIPDAKKGAVSVSLQTYSDSACTTKMGDAVTSSFEIVVPDSAAPTASAGWAKIAPYNTGTAASGMGVYVQGYSKAEVTFDASKVSFMYGAGIASLRIACDGAEVSASPYRTKLLTKPGSQTVRCTVTDTRGMTATEDIAINVQAYSAPVLSGISVYRCDSSGSPDDAGAHLYFKATCVYSDCAGENTLSLKAAYRPAANTAWTSETSITSGAGKVLGGSLLSTVSYTARIKATDRIGNTAEYTALIGTADVAFNIRPGGKGAAFGKFAEKEKTLDIDDWDIATTGKVQAASGEFTGNVKASGGEFAGKVKAAGGEFTGNVNAPNIFTMLDVYPVGSIYMSVNATSPQTLFGGTWVRIQDCFLLAAGSEYAAGSTGGEATHTLTVSEMPSHSHNLKIMSGDTAAANTLSYSSIKNRYGGGGSLVQNTGGDQPHNNMPPYLAVYVWQRVVDQLEPISGDIVQFEYYAGVPMNVVTHIEPVQEGSGDPGPDNIRPITGHTGDVLTRCGKNLCSPQWTVGEIDANTGQDSYTSGYIRSGYIKLKPGNIYTLSRGVTTGYIKIRGYAADKSYIGYGDAILTLISGGQAATAGNPMKEGDASCVIQLNSNVHYLRIVDTSTADTSAQFQVELGSAATEYEPYNGGTFRADFGQTVYGGTLDWNTGVLTVEWSNVRMADQNWTPSTAAVGRYLIQTSGTYARGIAPMCNIMPGLGVFLPDARYTLMNNVGSQLVVNTDFTTVDQFVAWLDENDAYMCYKLAEPITIQLTPQEILALGGVNTLYAEAGDITVGG